MNVKLAAQVLSPTVSKVLLKYGPPKAAGTAKCCFLMDMFFDIMNIGNINYHKFELKPWRSTIFMALKCFLAIF